MRIVNVNELENEKDLLLKADGMRMVWFGLVLVHISNCWLLMSSPFVVDACYFFVNMLPSNLKRGRVSSRPYFTGITSRLVPSQTPNQFYKHIKQMEYDNKEH